MNLTKLKDLLQKTNAMRSALNREVNDRAVRPDFALIMMGYIQDLEVWGMERVGTKE